MVIKQRFCVIVAQGNTPLSLADFLLRLSTSEMESTSTKSQTRVFLLPDGLEHPLFRKTTSGRGNYILCWKDALHELTDRGIQLISKSGME